MKITNLISVLALSIFLGAVSSGSSFASTVETTSSNEEILLQKQQEIDAYVFEEHADELAEKGFSVTHTGQIGTTIEIGISPYNQENADYLYALFGEELVIVVEGQLAVTMEEPTTDVETDEDIMLETTEDATLETSEDATFETNEDATLETNEDATSETSEDATFKTSEDTTLVDTTDNTNMSTTNIDVEKNEPTLPLPIIIAVAIALMLGIVLLAKGKLKK